MATYINNSPSRNVDPKIKENEVLKEQNTNLKEEIRKLSAHI
jgi:cell division protein FtsB